VTTERPLWSERHGRGPVASLDYWGVRSMFGAVISELDAQGWFQESFGYECVDAGFVPGRLGEDVDRAMLLDTGRSEVWPVKDHVGSWDDDTLFDMVEYLFRHVSAGLKETGRFHDFSGCGWHFNHFDQEEGQGQYRRKVNRVLARYGDGFELATDGEVERQLPQQVAELALPLQTAETTDEGHIAEAIRKYKSRVGLDRRDAVRDLADVLERLRPKVKEHLFSKDERALFQIANEFWVRHNNSDQLRHYNHDAWWDWLFHV
jgi:hypothetical protein